jgi:CRP-like cAMP-binding protein
MIAQALTSLHQMVSSPTQVFALCSAAIAGALTVTSSFVKTMVPLRWLALLSNCGFLAYGLLHPSLIMVIMHATLLPINVVRLREMLKLTRRVTAATTMADSSGIWLKPYMKATRHKAGHVLFRQGDLADHLYLLAEGEVEFIEIQQSVGPGRVFGEIAFFSPSRRRTLTARCKTNCLLLSVNHSTVRELYYQNPAFGFELVNLVAARLSADVSRLQKQIADMQASLDAGAAAGAKPPIDLSIGTDASVPAQAAAGLDPDAAEAATPDESERGTVDVPAPLAESGPDVAGIGGVRVST